MMDAKVRQEKKAAAQVQAVRGAKAGKFGDKAKKAAAQKVKKLEVCLFELVHTFTCWALTSTTTTYPPPPPSLSISLLSSSAHRLVPVGRQTVQDEIHAQV